MMKVRKIMKVIGILFLSILILIGIFYFSVKFLKLWNDGAFIHLMPSYKEGKKLSKEYGGVYVFYPEFREEIKKRERERKELFEKIKDEISSNPRAIKDSDGTTKIIYDTDFTRINEALPQTLSNGCKYHNQAFGPYDSLFDSDYEKIKEFVGEEVYKKLKPSLTITSFYRCEDGREGLITIYTDILDIYTQYGLFGDTGKGIRLTNNVLIKIGGSNTFELRDGKFVKTEEIAGGFR